MSSGFAAHDQLREAIQLLSPEAGLRRIFTHTGWRKFDTGWGYLTASGAIGVEGIEVDLDPELRRYSLPLNPEDPLEAMKLSLKLLRVAPLGITAPLFASVFRAPLSSLLGSDTTLWLEGKTGSLKSTLAALFLSHWGSFERLTLPADWRSTGNSLEKQAFTLKDALLVIDEYVPGAERKEFELKAARVIRAQGNQSGRGRLRADLTGRPTFKPRGLILATGEEHPPGQSILARGLIIEVRRSDLDLALLTELQVCAGRLAHALSGYIGWLVPQIDDMRASLPGLFKQLRAKAGQHVHLRMPEVLAHLGIGLDYGLGYAVEIGATTEEEAKRLRQACWTAMVRLATEQGRRIQEESPTRRFFEILNTLLLQERVQLLSKTLELTDKTQGTMIGWQDAEFYYLLPEAAYQAVCRFTREGNETFPISKNRLLLNLVQEGFSIPSSGRNTAPVRIGSSTRRVIRLKRAMVEKLLGTARADSGATGVTAVTAPEE